MKFSQNISLANANIINNNNNNNSTFSEVIFMQAGNKKTKVETLFMGDHYIFGFLREGSYLEVFYVCVYDYISILKSTCHHNSWLKNKLFLKIEE